MEIPSDTLEAGGVNEMFVVVTTVTVDVSFTTEQAVSGYNREGSLVGVLKTFRVPDKVRKGVWVLRET